MKTPYISAEIPNVNDTFRFQVLNDRNRLLFDAEARVVSKIIHYSINGEPNRVDISFSGEVPKITYEIKEERWIVDRTDKGSFLKFIARY